MFTREISIVNPMAAKKFVDTTSKYRDFAIRLRNGDYLIDGRSIMGLLSLDPDQITELVIEDEPSKEFLKDMEPFMV